MFPCVPAHVNVRKLTLSTVVSLPFLVRSEINFRKQKWGKINPFLCFFSLCVWLVLRPLLFSWEVDI